MTCRLCPRNCGDRARGFCGQGAAAAVALVEGKPYMLHRFEQPVIAGTRGSGAIFFVGCNLRCVYCQNADISRGRGASVTLDENDLSALFSEAAAVGDTLSLVTAAHFIAPVSRALQAVRDKLRVPVVYNSSGYESVSSLRLLDGLIDVYLPDFKHVDAQRAARYSHAADYPQVARAAIAEMYRQVGAAKVRDGLLRRGMLVRHLVLPGGREEGAAVMREIAALAPGALVSVMRQYTPAFCPDAYPELKRRVTSFEYATVVNEAARLHLGGFMQGKGCESKAFTPAFD